MSRRYAARGSSIHGRGVFALQPLEAGVSLGEFRGRRTPWEEVEVDEEAEAGHTFVFDLGDGTVLDGGHGGNSLRWLNHGCEPSCQAVQDGARIWFETIRPVAAGEELLIDYALQVEPDGSPEDYRCRCGAATCRGTMLEPPQSEDEPASV